MQQLELDFTAAQCWRGPDWEWLMLKIDNAPAARRWIDQMSGDCTVTLGPKRRKRSLDANAYLWVLCDQIAKAIRSTKEEVYRAAIKRVGVVDVIPMREDAAAEWCRRWRSRGIGWVVETADAGLDGWVEVLAYWGSSTYSASEMSRLLDDVIEEAKGLGIETATPEQLALMREEWGNGRRD